ncbi:DUF305 domain-containing protein [Rhizohabitans arisaemae]|uniref:DUF305 domain-containing protein n=1 Tax=Rhizohabitans arisaemae TaxID=2720610 RepID=UPI0024B257C7|nr:DUF305 domain-containing protein [Rhizohabitans arisaemae]
MNVPLEERAADAEAPAGPGGTDPAPPASAHRRRRTAVLAAIAVLALAAAAAFLLTRPSTPADSSPEAGFARDMGTHHDQAVDMAFTIRDRSQDEVIRGLATDIIVTQTAQRGMFQGWLQVWGLTPTGDSPAMAWMSGHGGHGDTPGVMPGMATVQQLNELRAKTGKDAEILFLQLMIKHHRGGVDMAKGLLQRSSDPVVRRISERIVDGQLGEIDLMNRLLADRGVAAA